MSADVTILGAGIAGLTMATALTQRGAQVRLIDPNLTPGAHCCSWWAGGMLAPECEGFVTEQAVVRHGRDAASWWEEAGMPVCYNGTLVVALGRDQSDLKTFARRVDRAQPVSGAELGALEPDLAERFSRGLFVPDEAHVDPRDTLETLHQSLARQGVTIAPDGPHQGQIIDCRGLAARDELDDLRGVKGEMVVVRCPDITLHRPVRLLHPRFPLYIVPREDGVFMLGATQIESGARNRATVRSVMELLNAAYALHPAFGEAELLEIGVDARPAFADNHPRIRHTGQKIYLNGLFRHGFLLAPALARMTTDMLLDGTPPEDWYEDHR